MSKDPRDELWDSIFRIYYDAFYEELVAEKIVRRWQVLHEVTAVLVAVTASGSAVSGWALWQQPGFKLYWSIFAGLGALLAVVHAALAVPRRLKEWSEANNDFMSLRIDIDTLRERMRFNPAFDIQEFSDELLAYRKKYSEQMGRTPNDLLLTDKLANKTQDELNDRLADEIEPT